MKTFLIKLAVLFPILLMGASLLVVPTAFAQSAQPNVPPVAHSSSCAWYQGSDSYSRLGGKVTQWYQGEYCNNVLTYARCRVTAHATFTSFQAELELRTPQGALISKAYSPRATPFRPNQTLYTDKLPFKDQSVIDPAVCNLFAS